MRRKLEGTCPRHDLKRGFGGLADIEFIVQYLQLVHASKSPEVVCPNLWDALAALRKSGLLDPEAAADLRRAYSFLRAVEGRLRIVHNRRDADLPDHPDELARLARRLHYEGDDRDGPRRLPRRRRPLRDPDPRLVSQARRSARGRRPAPSWMREGRAARGVR